jgi:hypothetical protein
MKPFRCRDSCATFSIAPCLIDVNSNFPNYRPKALLLVKLRFLLVTEKNCFDQSCQAIP